MQKLNVILDLDNTLLVSVNLSTVSPDVLLNNECAYVSFHPFERYLMVARPYLRHFLEELNKIANISIWTAATKEYAKLAVHHFFPKGIRIHKFYTQEDTVKYLKTTGRMKPIDAALFTFPLYNRCNTFIIDDLPDVYKSNPTNTLRIVPYTEHNIRVDDTELLTILNTCIDQYYFLNAHGCIKLYHF